MKWFLIMLLLFSMPQVYGKSRRRVVNELGFDFNYSKQVYGSVRQNSVRKRTYSGSYALYFLSTTALELNYSYGEEVTTENHDLQIEDTDYSIIGFQNVVESEVFGIGIRQAFAGPKSRLKPMISLGYAKQFIKDKSTITLRNNTNGAVTTLNNGSSQKRTDSVFGSFALQFRLMGSFFLKGSVKTVFPAFKTNLAKDYLTYSAGFSWMF